MEARIKEREDSQINNTIAAPLLNITEEQLSLSVEDIGVSVNILIMPIAFCPENFVCIITSAAYQVHTRLFKSIFC